MIEQTGIRECFDYPSKMIGDCNLSEKEPKILDNMDATMEETLAYRTEEFPAVYQVKGCEEYVQQMSLSVEPSHMKEVLIEKGLLESWAKEHHGLVHEVPHIVQEINKFSTRVETLQDKIDWKEFHRNLLKVHDYYVNNIYEEKEEDKHEDKEKDDAVRNSVQIVDDVYRAELDIETVMSTLNNLIVQSKRLTNNIQCVDHKITSLDHKIEQFYRKYNQTLIEREKAFQDMIALHTLRSEIERKLLRMETEIHASRVQIHQQGVRDR